MTSPRTRPGRTNGFFYGKLRCNAPGLIEDLKEDNLPYRIAAARHGLKRGTYERLRRFVANHRELVRLALETGDWSAIEEILFARVPRYPHYPCYIDALVEAGAASDVKARRPQRGRPKGARNRQPGAVAAVNPQSPAARRRKPKRMPSRLSRIWRGIARLFGSEA